MGHVHLHQRPMAQVWGLPPARRGSANCIGSTIDWRLQTSPAAPKGKLSSLLAAHAPRIRGASHPQPSVERVRLWLIGGCLRLVRYAFACSGPSFYLSLHVELQAPVANSGVRVDCAAVKFYPLSEAELSAIW